MKKFKSHKEVTATPMNHLDYNVYRGWELPSDENGEDDGYLVEYLDGGESNHPDHKGYISWSPKRQFDEGYTRVLPDYQQRVVDEMNELADKTNKLMAFLKSEKSQELAAEDFKLMKDQWIAMGSYVFILSSRIDRF